MPDRQFSYVTQRSAMTVGGHAERLNAHLHHPNVAEQGLQSLWAEMNEVVL
ncbi:MAG: hypothetical protein QOG80_592, partial [Pseudonocardiales bacterium]|nr:hypothetical protein [Pseudonocardiales bacterium]